MFKTNENFENSNISQNPEAETIIGPMVKLQGDFIGKGNVIVAGEIVGNVKTDKTLVIEEGSKVSADVSALDIRVAGTVDGKVEAFERLELASTARIKGNISAKVLVVNAGAVFNGDCVMGNEPIKQEFPASENSDENKKKKKNDE